MVARVRLLTAPGALLATVVIVVQTASPAPTGGPNSLLSATGAP
jgi:hypothetical protein